MADDPMDIATMCRTFDVTPRTLRFYEAKGLLRPVRSGQKRLFTRSCRARLTLVLQESASASASRKSASCWNSTTSATVR